VLDLGTGASQRALDVNQPQQQEQEQDDEQDDAKVESIEALIQTTTVDEVH